MTLDVAALLQELDLAVREGSTRDTLLLLAPDGVHFEVEPVPPVERLTAHSVRTSRPAGLARPTGPAGPTGHHRALHVGRAATDGVLKRAEAGEIDVLTAEPIRLIHVGRTYTTAPEPIRRKRPRPTRRPAWTRWAVERYLLLNSEPSRQAAIAEALGTTQQSVSQAATHLGDLVVDRGRGLVAADRARLLEHWREEYTGAGGLEFGWYSLDSVIEQVERVVELVRLLEGQSLVSGDVAADRLAPWKLPARGRVYVDRPVDLAGDGFVAVPLEEASLVTCVPRDPSLWTLAPPVDAATGSENLPNADAVIVYWDLYTSGDMESEEAAEQVAALITGARR